MKKLLVIALFLLALAVTAVACTGEPAAKETTADTTIGETPTEAPETPTEAPEVPTDAPEVPTEAPEVPTDAPEVPTEAPEVPTDASEVPTEAPETETVDPDAPAWIIDAEGLAAMTNANAATVALTTHGNAAGFTATSGDPWFLVTGNIGVMPEYLVFSYRTNTTQQGEIFTGNGAGPEGGKSFVYNYNANGEWNLMVLHLPTVATYMTDSTIGHIRFDFYTGGAEEGAYLEVAYMAFFNTAEAAEKYDAVYHAPAKWDEKKDVVTHQSFDELRKVIAGAEADGVFTPGQSAGWDFIADLTSDVEALKCWGWVGVKGEIGLFGYKIDNGPAIFDASFAVEAAQDVINAAADTGADNASRFLINIDLAGLEGEHTVSVFYKTADAYTALLNTFTVKMPVIPSWGDDHTIITHQAFDALQRFSAGADAGYVFTPGQANSWNYVAECASSVDAIGYMGWVGIKGEIGQFGYSIDNGAYIFADEFTWETEQGIIDAAKTTGADTGSRFWVNIDLSVLEVGEHNIRVVYKNTAGEMVMLNEFKLVKLP